MKTYTVVKGDNLTKIANKFGVTVSAIQEANSSLIKDVNKISIGWKLNIPEASKNYETIGKQLEACIKDIKNLDSFKRLSSSIKG